MTDPHDVVVRAQVLGGQWETIGVDRLRGIMPEGIQLTANEWGPDQCSFALRGETGPIRADLSAWTPLEVDVAGVTVWDGRIKETPTQDGADGRVVNVQAEGWQYHLDDDVYQSMYVHTRLTDWVDVRSYPTCDLALHSASWNVTVGDGAVVFSNQSTGGVSFPRGAVVFDGGYAGAIQRASIDWEKNQWVTGNFAFLVWDDDLSTLFGHAAMSNIISLASATNSGTTSTVTVGARYLMICCDTNTAQNADRYFRVRAARLFGSANYVSAGQSTLTADDVVSDAIDEVAPLLSTDRSGIAAGTFTIDEFAPQGAHTPREAWSAANAYENYDTRVEVGRRPVFRPRPAAAIYEIGEWAGADFSDASANSGQDIYNRALVEGTGPDGSPLTVERFGSGNYLISSAVTHPNPSAAVNTSGWTTDTSVTLTRDTVVFDTTPASFKVEPAGSETGIRSSFSGTWQRGRVYRVSIRIRRDTGMLRVRAKLTVGASSVEELHTSDNFAVSSWQTIQLTIAPSVTTSSATLAITGLGESSGIFLWADSITIEESLATIIDRRGFVRAKILQVGSSLTTAVGQLLADLYLTAHRATPFRGGFQTVGQGGIRRVLGGTSPHPAWLLRDTTQQVRCPVTDVDTGDWTRDARMVSVTYDHDSLTSVISLDEDREGFDTLLARYAVVVGQRP